MNQSLAITPVQNLDFTLLLPLLALMLYMGAYPRPFLDRSRASVEQIRARILGGESQGLYRAEAEASK